MPQDLGLFLTLILSGCLVGAVLGWLLRRYRTSWCLSWAKSCNALPWWVFGCSAIMFLIFAASQLPYGRYSFAGGFLGFAVLEVVAMIFALRRKRLSVS